MNFVRHALKSFAVVVVIATLSGCTKTDLTVTELSVTSCTSTSIAYTFTILNRDFTGTLFMGPAALGKDVGFQAWVSSTQTLNENDAADRPAGGGTLLASLHYGSDELLTPGESVTESFASGSPSSPAFDPAVTPYLILKVDPRNLFDPESTKDGAINEYSEGNNERFVLIGTCN